MIELYTWMTPNGQKVSIMLEEVGLPYRVHAIDITKGEQFAPAFLKIAPNNRIPAIVDTDNGLHLMESGAILLYLAEKTGQLWPQDFPTKWRVVEWLMWQMGGPGPFLGQVHHFVKFNPGKSAYAEERYAGQTVDFADYPNVKRWYLAIAARPAVKRGWDVLHEGRAIPMP